MRVTSKRSRVTGQTLEIISNPDVVAVRTKKNERKIVVVVLNHRNKTLEIPVTLDVAEKSSVFCVICCTISGSSDIKLITRQKHHSAAGTSDLLCKTVLLDSAKFSFTGTISISKAGQKSHAYQRNENLVLGTESRVVSEPKLEILANDVFCTHGSTTGYLDDEQVFYLQSRGMNRQRIEALLSEGFLLSGLDNLVKAGVDLQKIERITTDVVKALRVE